jgi:hypothetical protein
MTLALKYLGHRCTPDSVAKPWYFAGSLDLEPGTIVRVPPGGIVLGRGRAADVRVASNVVARAHARVWPDEDGASLAVEDLGSTNGTSSSRGESLRHHLVLGDVLTLALAFDFEVVAAP